MSASSMLNCGLATCWVGLISLALPGHADEVPTPTVTLQAELRVPNGANTYQYVPATQVAQGQEIDYTLRIANPGASSMAATEVVQALPDNTHYVAGSASGAGADIQFSVDGGHSFAKPGALKSPSSPSVTASARDYTHIRWQLRYPLAPKAVVLARFRAVFE